MSRLIKSYLTEIYDYDELLQNESPTRSAVVIGLVNPHLLKAARSIIGLPVTQSNL